MDQFKNDLTAELLALNTAVHQLLDQAAEKSGNRKAYLSAVLERGLEAIGTTNLWSTPENQREAVYESARARFSDIVASIRS
jgi:hypothetical protein